MNRAKALKALMKLVAQSVTKSLYRARGHTPARSIVITGPSLDTKARIGDIILAPIMTPSISLQASERADTAMSFISHLGEPVMDRAARKVLKGRLGTTALSFILHGATPEHRYTRLLWLLAQCPGVEMERGPNTLLVHDITAVYGVRDGIMVGGGYEGVPLTLPVMDVVSAPARFVTRAQRVVEVHNALKRRTDAAAFEAFKVLYTVSQWDEGVPMQSLLIPKITGFPERIARLSDEIMESDEPYKVAFSALVPYFMTYSDFRRLIGDPCRRVNKLRITSKAHLINKLYQLPFSS